MLACRRRNRSRSSERPLKPSGTFDRKVYSKTLANTPSVTRTEQSGAWLRDAIKNIGVHFTAHTMEMRCYDKWEYSSTILLWTILAGNTVQLSYYGPFQTRPSHPERTHSRTNECKAAQSPIGGAGDERLLSAHAAAANDAIAAKWESLCNSSSVCACAILPACQHYSNLARKSHLYTYSRHDD